jgi:hypothetical protein
MKGFLYLVEIIIAAVLIAIIFQSFFAAQNNKTDWARSDLIGIGNNVMDILGPDVIKTINETGTFEGIEDMKAANIRYTMKFSGVPKNTITVGTNDKSYVESILGTEAYINNRIIKFNVSSLIYNFETYDVIITTNTFDYSNQTLKDFEKDKTVIGIGEKNDDENFRNFFNIIKGDPADVIMNFTEYNDIAKYFFGIGFNVLTPTGDIEDSSYGEWYISGQKLIVNTTMYSICISNPPGCLPNQ